MSRKTKVLIMGFALLLVSSTGWATTIDTGTNPLTIELNDANWDPWDICIGETKGMTSLMDLGFLDSSTDADIGIQLESQFGGAQYSNDGGASWGDLNYIYEYSTEDLTGTFLVDWYKAFDAHGGELCYHGAEIVAFYDYGEGESSQNFNLIQMYDETGGSQHHPPYDHVVDSGPDGDPAYYSPGYGPWYPSYYEEDGNGEEEPGKHDMQWSDRPYDSHIESDPWSGSVAFSLFMASYGTVEEVEDDFYEYQRTITIYDGITWGYTGYCDAVPEPSTILLLGIGIAGILKRQRRKNI